MPNLSVDSEPRLTAEKPESLPFLPAVPVPIAIIWLIASSRP